MVDSNDLTLPEAKYIHYRLSLILNLIHLYQ